MSRGISIGEVLGNGTAKSILYVDANGYISEDNTNLFWDYSTNLLNANGIQFSLTPSVTMGEGILAWNSDDGTLNLGMPGGDVSLQIGQELLIKVKASEDISNGQMVYVDGADGSNPTVSLAQANAETTAHQTIAMATEDIANNQSGYVTVKGLVRDINTLSYTAGTQLYLDASTAGNFTDTEPTNPNYSVTIGYVVRQHATEGVVLVDIHADVWKTFNDNVKFYFGDDRDTSIYHDGTNFNIDTDEVAPSDLTIDCGTDKTLVLEVPVYRDINLSAALTTLAVANNPGKDEIVDEAGADTGITTYAFAVGELVSGIFEMQHDYKEGSDITFHVHWQGIAAPTGTDNVQWQLIYTITRDGNTVNAPTTITSGDTAFDTQYETVRTDFSAIDGSTGGIDGGNIKIGDQFCFQLQRIASTGDAYAGDALLLTAGLHVQVDTIGSRQIGTK